MNESGLNESFIAELKGRKEHLELEKIKLETDSLNVSTFKKPAPFAFLISLFSLVLTISILAKYGFFDLEFQKLKSIKASFDLELYNYKCNEELFISRTSHLLMLQDAIKKIEKQGEVLSEQSLSFKSVSSSLSLEKGSNNSYLEKYKDSLRIKRTEYASAKQSFVQIKTELKQIDGLFLKEKKEADKLDKILSVNKIVNW